MARARFSGRRQEGPPPGRADFRARRFARPSTKDLPRFGGEAAIWIRPGGARRGSRRRTYAFDFANRTGRIVFDVDAFSPGSLATYVEIDLTDDPVPAPTFREFQNFEAGPVPRNGLMMKWSDNCASNGSLITLGNVLAYADYAPSTRVPVGGAACATTKQGSMNHFEILVKA